MGRDREEKEKLQSRKQQRKQQQQQIRRGTPPDEVKKKRQVFEFFVIIRKPRLPWRVKERSMINERISCVLYDISRVILTFCITFFECSGDFVRNSRHHPRDET